MEIKLLVLHHTVKGADLNSSSSWSHPTLLTTPPPPTGNALENLHLWLRAPYEITRTSVSSLTFIPS